MYQRNYNATTVAHVVVILPFQEEVHNVMAKPLSEN